jgi:ATP-dependent helicase/nuclease subunit B
MTTPLIDLISPGTVVVTAGQRLYRHLSQDYARICRARGLLVWETLAILTLGSWLSRLWEEAIDAGADTRLLLNDSQEAALWEQIVAQSTDYPMLSAPPATARIAQDAWSLLHAWDIARAELARGSHEDVVAFAGWADAFDEQCRRQNWLDNARLANTLTSLIAAKKIPVPVRVIFAGFDEFTPAQRRLIDALRSVGCDAVTLPSPQNAGAIVRMPFRSATDEIQAAAEWARHQLDQNPDKRLGVIAPDLSTHGALIRRAFDDVLIPAAILPVYQDAPRPYNMSYGEPLVAQAPVRTALNLLALAEGALPLTEMGELLRSPYLAGGDSEMTSRARVDAALRRIGDVRVSAASLLRVLARPAGDAILAPVLAEHVQQFRTATRPAGQRRTPSQWLTVFVRLLQAMGWPGERSLSSAEHQIVSAWKELLSVFSALDAVLPAMRYGDALVRVQQLAQEKLFQIETAETPVQILGAFEASGLQFDALWVMGLTDDVWPAAPRPNPFLPVALQRARGVPHASADREFEFCMNLTQRLLASAPDVVLSHPEREQDRQLRPSPLIRDYAVVPPMDISATRYRDLVRASGTRETLIDSQASELAPGTFVRGGTALFRSQSACAFRAYAEFRLGARALDEPEPGLAPSDRGTLLHGVLTRVWTDIGSHAQLVGTAQLELLSRVTGAVRDEVERLQRKRPESVTDSIVALEVERLVTLVLEWLDIERQRTPFVVRPGETPARPAIAGLVTEVRMDRVDELGDGTLAVIDYKTGIANVNDWFGARPAEPQLPLYALFGVPLESVSAILYARVRRGESKFVGVSQRENVAPRVEPHDESRLAMRVGSWESLFEDWTNVLTRLAEEHRTGQASVNPRDRNVCRQCHLHAFCRVHERRVRLADAGLEEGDDE